MTQFEPEGKAAGASTMDEKRLLDANLWWQTCPAPLFRLRYRDACRPPASYGVRPSACLRRAGSIAVTIAFSWRNFGEDPEGKLAK
jgi:hypothetical protein